MTLPKNRYMIDPEILNKLTTTVASDLAGRGPARLCKDDLWQSAINLIRDKEKIAIISGFFVPSASAPETDGPPGSIVIARALLNLGYDVEIWTDDKCLICFRKCASVMSFPESRVLDMSIDNNLAFAPDLLIYIERLGRAADGFYYNMRGENISSWTAPLDRFAEKQTIPIIAIGDGGNEVGMGSLHEQLSEIMPSYSRYLCVIKSDVCIPVDVSNWGAYALTTALSSIAGEWLGQTEEEDLLMLQALCDCGVVDGVTKECGLSVDGLPLTLHQKTRSSLEKLII